MRTTTLVLSTAALLLLAVPAAGAVFGQDSVSVPAPVAGDAGLYGFGETGPSVEPGYERAFEVREPREVTDAYGRDHQAHLVLEHALFDGEVAVSTGSTWTGHEGPPINRSTAFEAGFDGGSDSGFGPSFSFDLEDSTNTFSSRTSDPLPDACALVATVQGDTLHEGRPAPDQVCGRSLTDGSAGDGLDVDVQVVDVTEHEGGTLAQVTLEVQAPEANGTVDAWFRDDIPYPIEIRSHAEREADVTWKQVYERYPRLELVDAWAMGGFAPPTENASAVHRDHATLERFQRGNGTPLPADELPAWPDRSPTMDFEPVDRWGPADGGSPFEYPIEAAADSIEQDPTLVDLQAWMDEHPEFRSLTARYATEVENGQRTETWTFVLVAPDETGWQVTSERPTGVGPDGPLVEASPPASDNEAEQVSRGNATYPPEVDQAPTIASAVDAWGDREDQAPEPNRVWFVRHPSHVRLGVGHSSQDGPTDPQDPFTFGFGSNSTVLTIDPEDGALLTHSSSAFAVGSAAGPKSADRTGFAAPSTAPAGLSAPPVVTGAAVTGALALALLLAAKLGILPFYTRLSRDELLEHEGRRRVYEAIDEAPGCALATVAERADITRSTTRYHLRRLEDAGLVQSVKAADARRFFPAGYDPDEMEREALLATGRTRDVYEAIRADPGASLQEISQQADIAASSAHRIVERLEEAGLVERGRSGRSVELRATE